MPILSSSDAAYFELLIDSDTSEISLGPLLYAAGAWPDSVEIYVNGLLQSMVGQYTTSSTRVIFVEPLQAGDTVRIIALESTE